MNVAISQKTPGRSADLNPFNITVAIEAAQALPLVGETGRGDLRNDWRGAGTQYGCVDWYQYPDQANEDKLRQAIRAAQAVMDQYTSGAGLNSE